MTAISFGPEFLDALLSGSKQQTTRSIPPIPPKRPRFEVGDVAQIYNQQRRRITDKPEYQLTELGFEVMKLRCSMMTHQLIDRIFYAHFLGKVEIIGVHPILPAVMSVELREVWAKADGFADFATARCWFEIRHGARWMDKWWTVVRWDGWLERYFLADGEL